jgi:HlyD family secretion protein
VIRRVIVALVAALVLLGLLVYSQQRHEPFKVSGFIEADEIRVGSRVGGRVANVFVDEGEAVKPDTLLVELEPFDLLEKESQAQSVLAERRAELDKLTNGFRAEEIAAGEQRVAQLTAMLKKLRNGPREQEITAAQANLDQADSLLRLALDKHKRVEALLPSRAATQQDMDQANSELRVARATQQARAADLDLLRAGTRPEEIGAATAQLGE